MQLSRLGPFVVTIALLSAPVAAQGELASAAEDLKGIRAALDRLVRLQELGRHHEEMELVLRRIEMRERRLGPLEQRLQRAEVEVRNHADHLKTLEQMRIQHKDQLDEEIRTGNDESRSETRRMLDDIDRTFESVTDREKEATLRLHELQDEIAEQKEEIEILDDRLTELLERKLPKE